MAVKTITYDPQYLNDFPRTYTYLHKVLVIYSQELSVHIIERLKSEPSGLKPTELLDESHIKVKSFVLSRILKHLREAGIVGHTKGRYYLKDKTIYDLLTRINLTQEKPAKPLQDRVRENAETFNKLFFGPNSHILMHIVSSPGRSFSEILEIYNRHHGYMSEGALRYNLNNKVIPVCGVDVPLFEAKGDRYYLNPVFIDIYDAFQQFLNEYREAFGRNLRKVLSIRVKDASARAYSIAWPKDPINKIIDLLRQSRVIVVFKHSPLKKITLEPIGIINPISFINGLLLACRRGSDLSSLTAIDFMEPIRPSDILPQDAELRALFDNKGKFEREYCLVELDGSSYGLLDLSYLLDKLSTL